MRFMSDITYSLEVKIGSEKIFSLHGDFVYFQFEKETMRLSPRDMHCLETMRDALIKSIEELRSRPELGPPKSRFHIPSTQPLPNSQT